MKKVVLVSPYSGNLNLSVGYAKLCLQDMLEKGEAPIAGHLLFNQPGIFKDNCSLEEQNLKTLASHAWIKGADGIAVYEDFKVTSEMDLAIKVAWAVFTPIVHRRLSREKVEELKKLYPDEA